MSEDPLTPGEAMPQLYRAIALPGVFIVAAYLPQDLANLRRAHRGDAAFALTVQAVAREIVAALKAPSSHGVDTGFELAGWRRSKFASSPGGGAHLRLVFRAHKGGGIDILAFGDRDLPQSVYYTAKRRR